MDTNRTDVNLVTVMLFLITTVMYTIWIKFTISWF